MTGRGKARKDLQRSVADREGSPATQTKVKEEAIGSGDKPGSNGLLPGKKRWPRNDKLVLLSIATVVVIAVATEAWHLYYPARKDAPMIIDARLAQVLRERSELAEALGEPAANPVSCGATLQPFEHGFMLWTSEEPDAYLACVNEATRTCRSFGLSALAAGDRLAIDGLRREVRILFNPRGGFLTTWIHWHLQGELGDPVVPEQGFKVLLQRFAGGVLVRDLPWFRREDRQFLTLPETQPVLALTAKGQAFRWSYVGKYGG